MINGVNNSQGVTQIYGNSKKAENSKAQQKSVAKEDEAAVLELGKSKTNVSVTYNKPTVAVASEETTTAETAGTKNQISKLNAEEINRLWEKTNMATQNLRDMVEELLKSQGMTIKDALSGKKELVVDEKTRAAAAVAISEDGELGVKAVSDRIVAFAKAISNDNPEMYDKLMSAIDEGFAQAEKALGGQLPEISKQTRAEIQRKMKEWKNEKASSVDASTAGE